MSRADDITTAFRSFREELDEHHDRREAIIKVSRDVTALSKKLIFHLHRTGQPGKAASILTEAQVKQTEILKLLESIAPQLQDGNFWRYQRNITGGIQEFLEAVSFMHYLGPERSIITFAQASQLLQERSIRLTEADYLLGLADLTGELMRLGISSVGLSMHRNALAEAELAVRALKNATEPLAAHVPHMYRKLSVTGQSLRKLEDARYTLALRAKEYENAPDMMRELVRRMQEESVPHVEELAA
ncbi:uncharacterized protein L969DRAFT_89557 [Mixia osmundae IAM 14324]|uniref:Translin n=1 Tax=Mixia osmundae (strain CBS 9802 / IAM 14324 / JCM 22182 / KY 12970) TaxID=764103 RepID=G7EA43_MIXOS|nr:uncharacterized protein L969DRAFT_89557 [Mixia osmundae IAM 14324]KEI37600.1 hypothetical protein L969DRAFT_89557 [Mixia osmundae IAM 14324]GAA99703.1 hypothetical protein E5Q_06406 [Mixia osmundae IAM 14324]